MKMVVVMTDVFALLDDNILSFEGRNNSFLYYKEWCADGMAFS